MNGQIYRPSKQKARPSVPVASPMEKEDSLLTDEAARQPTALDLFCGCGGLSAGLEQAGFRIIGGVDSEPKYSSAFRMNFPQAVCITEDLSLASPSSLMRRMKLEPGEIDLLAGGPPCQGFSKNVPRKHRHSEDPNNKLVRRFLDYCQALEPRAILMENVAEMRQGFGGSFTYELINRLDKSGYTVGNKVVNSADYGVPQRRRRAFFVALKGSGSVMFPPETHVAIKNTSTLIPISGHVTVWDAIGDLCQLQSGQGVDPTEYANSPASAYQYWARNGQDVVYNHIARDLQPEQLKRISSLNPGQSLKDLPVHLQVRGGYSGAYGRLTETMVAPTITRWVFHPGSGRWGHPRDNRLITIREAARLQGFPDWFRFTGSYIQQAAQVGNAAPPLLVERLSEPIFSYLFSNKSASSDIDERLADLDGHGKEKPSVASA